MVAENQRVYTGLLRLGWDVTLVVPKRWRHEYAPEPFTPAALPELEGRMRTLATLLEGRPGRHVYLARLGPLIRSVQPTVAFVEEETYAAAAFQWAVALARARVPFGVQADENLDRPLPWLVRLARSWVLRRAAFVAARSPAAADLVGRWGGPSSTPLVPHAVPEWVQPPAAARAQFTIGYAGRLVAEKGLLDLVRAAEALNPPPLVLLVGDGPLGAELEGRPNVSVRTGLTHEAMPTAYAEMDVLVLPSRTTPTWAEQFGRVLLEALFCGVPVVGSSSGEIPWVIGVTEGGIVFPEGDVASLAEVLRYLRDDPGERRRLASRGRTRAVELFGERAAAAALGAALEAAITLSDANGGQRGSEENGEATTERIEERAPRPS